MSALAACEPRNDELSAPLDPAAVASVVITPDTPVLVLGESLQLTAAALSAGGEPVKGTEISWNGGDPLVATLSESGLVTAVGLGSAPVTAAGGGRSVTITVNVVPVPVATVTVSPASGDLVVGERTVLEAVLRDSRGQPLDGRIVTWTSSNPAIASVSDRGEVAGLAPGQVTIAAASGGHTGSALITISEAPAQRIALSPAAFSLLVGQSLPLSIVVIDALGNQLGVEGVTWSSSAPQVATVADGIVTAVSPGTASIRASMDGATATALATVSSPIVTSVEVTPALVALVEGGRAMLTAHGRDASGHPVTGRQVSWHSLNPAAVSVSSTGEVTGLTPGSAAVAASIDGQTGSASVTVTPMSVAAISISPTSAELDPGQTVPLVATPRNPAGEPIDRTVTWASASPATATVSPAGIVSAVAPGTALITARAGSVSGSATILVRSPSVASVVVSPGTLSLQVGQGANLAATALDAVGQPLGGQSFQWSTTAPGVATVSAAGRVTAVAVGSAIVTATTAGKSASASVVVAAIPVATVEVSPGTATLTIGGTRTLTATPRAPDGTPLAGRPVAWTSSQAAVATVSAAGVVTGVAAGSATVTAQSEGKSGAAAIVVTTVPVASVRVTPGSSSLTIGASVTLAADVLDASGGALAGRSVSWASSSPAVATVTTSGRVTAVAAGSATITATSEGKSGTASVSVSAAPVATVAVTPATASVSVGSSVTLAAEPRDGFGNLLTGRPVTWASSSTSIATVSGTGVVTGVAAGAATITATVEGKTGTGAVSVTAIPVASVSVSPLSADLVVGGTQAFAATAKDASGTPLAGRVATWVSTVPAVATVSTAGVATAVAAGSAIVRATVEGKSAQALVTVTPVPVAAVSVSPVSATLVVGETEGLTANPVDGSGNPLAGRVVTWASGKTSVATVSSSGLVTAVAPGATGVTATVEGRVGTASITVSTVPVATVTVAPATASLVVGDTQTLTATARDAGGAVLTDRPVTWTSGAVSVATVSGSGVATAVAAGSTTITATVEGIAAAAAIAVSAAPVATVTVAPAALGLTVGQTGDLTATPKDAGGATLTGRAVSWTSASPAVATVSTSGRVTAVAAGSASVSATVEGKSGTSAVTVTSAAPASVVLSPAAVSLMPGQTQLIDPTVKDAAGNVLTGVTVTWSSSAPAVATVAASGTVTAVAQGSATVSATAGSVTGAAAVTVVPVPVASVSVSPTSAAVAIAETKTFAATVKDSTGAVLAGRPVTWASGSPAVATVSSGGIVTGVTAGATGITASAEGKVGTASVTITAAAVATVVVTPAAASISVGQTQPLTATPKDSTGTTLTGRTVTWTTSNAGVATVAASGLVTAVSAGSATITGTVEGVAGTAAITVVPPPVATVSVAPASASLSIGQTVGLTATPKDSAGTPLTGRSVSWSSNQPSVATVSAAGLVTAVASGAATVAATVEGQSGSSAVTVAGATTGTVSGVVNSPQLGPMAGVTVSAAGRTATTNGSGAYTLTSVPSGSASLTVTGVGSTCLAPAAVPVTVADGTTATANVGVNCNPAVTFPIRIASNKHYLEDQNGRPFFINAESMWSLLVQPTYTNANTYLNDRKAKGVNTILVQLITKFAAKAPKNVANEAPFTGANFTTPNEAYFAHADSIINRATSLGFMILLDVAYLGHVTDNGQGFFLEFQAAPLSAMRVWGEYVGNRYKNNPNIVWVVGGDRDPTLVQEKLDSIVAGIRTVDKTYFRLFTVHNNRDTQALTYWAGRSWLNLNNIYTRKTTLYNEAADAYQVSPTMPYFPIEMTYENEHSVTPDGLRKQAYWNVLRGATGHLFGNNPLWGMGYEFFGGGTNWAAQLNSPGSMGNVYLNKIFRTRNWHKLVPDLNGSVMTAGAGSSTTFTTTALASDGSSIIAYLPTKRTVTVDPSGLTGSTMHVYWVNPATGAVTDGGVVPKATIAIAPPATGDWVLVIDGQDMPFSAPGAQMP
ncbi:MAG: Ig-like domain-containing protein [Gemmatimonadales bacterium]